MSDDKTIVAPTPALDSLNATSSRSAPILLQYDGNAAGKRFVLTQTTVSIGRRADKVDVWIDDASVSREHCRVDFQGAKATVTDLGSLNHTFVNDRMVDSSADLSHGDMLRVGNVRLRYFSHGSADQLLFDKIYKMAVVDRMLDIFRKDFLIEKLDEEFRLARAAGGGLSLLLFDLDKFKSVNDTYGHDAGDLSLKDVCSAIKKLVRPTDTFGRFGGEEFVIVLPRTTLDQAYRFAEVIRQTVERLKIVYNGKHIPVTVSIGCAHITPDMTDKEQLLKMADVLVYQSKQGGRNRVSRP
jgi:two-component system cell cycle response regulator